MNTFKRFLTGKAAIIFHFTLRPITDTLMDTSNLFNDHSSPCRVYFAKGHQEAERILQGPECPLQNGPKFLIHEGPNFLFMGAEVSFNEEPKCLLTRDGRVFSKSGRVNLNARGRNVQTPLQTNFIKSTEYRIRSFKPDSDIPYLSVMPLHY